VRGCLNHWPLLRVAVAEQSMLPAFRPGDWLIAWRTRRIRPGQVVLAWHPARADFLLVKRAVRRVDGGWWLQSDNPAPGAVDSNRFGPVPEEKIVGRVLGRYWRPRRAGARPGLPPNVRAGPAPWRVRGPAAGALRRSGGQCRGGGGASAIRADCSSTSRSISWRGSLAQIAQ
jgi:nickel-type superoxide dismutase maturation protease